MPFALCIPGLPVFDNFEQVAENKFLIMLPQPQKISTICFFLQKSFPIPEASVVLYYTLPPGDEWHLLGCVSTLKPSEIFTTGWADKVEFRGQMAVQLGVQIESLDFASNIDGKVLNDSIGERQSFALRIANDLYTYMQSFAKSSPDGTIIVVQANVLDKWLERFKKKFLFDPGFLYSSNGK